MDWNDGLADIGEQHREPQEANELINEMEVFEFDMSKSGRVSYSAPSGFHDDCVDLLALANHTPGGGGPTI